MNNEHEVIPFSHPVVQKYLQDYNATREERRCLMMWIHDGHSHLDNDFNSCWISKHTDFLRAVFTSQYLIHREYSESFYDPRTQKYLEDQHATAYEMKTIRAYARQGYKFSVGIFGALDNECELLSSLRHREETMNSLGITD